MRRSNKEIKRVYEKKHVESVCVRAHEKRKAIPNDSRKAEKCLHLILSNDRLLSQKMKMKQKMKMCVCVCV